MNTYENFLSRALGLRVRKRALKRALGWVLLFAAIITPAAFTHAAINYGQRRAERITKWIFNPATNAIQKNFEKQMQVALARAQRSSASRGAG